MKNITTLFLILAAGLVPGAAASAQEAPRWAVSLGAFDVAGSDIPAEAGIEYRLKGHPVKDVLFRPAVGVSANGDGSFWAYGALRFEWQFADRWMLAPQVGVSLYEEGDGKDLGGPVEFRSGLEVSYRLASGARLGLLYYHLSNSRLYDLNPGANSAVLTWSFKP